jgi:calcineurin-like phosphoesterase family protein
MTDAAKLLTTLRRAVLAFRETPGRRGRLVSLENVDEVIVAGDLHGSVENFRLLLRRADLTSNPRRHLVLQEVIHGPFQYPGGGDKSHQMLDLVAALKVQCPQQVHFLTGNHELSQSTRRRIAKDDIDLNALFYQGVETAYGSRAGDVFQAYDLLFAAFPFALRTPNRVFLSHSLPSRSRLVDFQLAALERDPPWEGDVLPGGSLHSLVWGRDLSAENATAFLQIVDADLLITGHIPCDNGWEAPNDRQIVLDSIGTPACYCIIPTDRPLTHSELVGKIETL